jgi:hypothetical protein
VTARCELTGTKCFEIQASHGAKKFFLGRIPDRINRMNRIGFYTCPSTRRPFFVVN